MSGGQTGVDRAALDVALRLGIECGGYCPRGRRAEDGRIPDRYPLVETPTRGYAQRTLWNVRDSDATLALYMARLRGGTALTLRLARRLGRPHIAVDLAADADPPRTIRAWLRTNRPRVLNVAGPRESHAPGIAARARRVLRAVLDYSTE